MENEEMLFDWTTEKHWTYLFYQENNFAISAEIWTPYIPNSQSFQLRIKSGEVDEDVFFLDAKEIRESFQSTSLETACQYANKIINQLVKEYRNANATI